MDPAIRPRPFAPALPPLGAVGRWGLVAVLAGAFLLSPPARAQMPFASPTPGPARDAPPAASAMPAPPDAMESLSARYVSADGGLALVLDRTARVPLARFDTSPEILVLRPSPAPRGDLMLRTMDGVPVLRLTPYGAVTAYKPGHEGGIPVLRSAAAAPLGREAAAYENVAAEARRLAETTGASFRRGFAYHLEADGDALGPAGSAVLLAAVQNTSIALDSLMQHADARAALMPRLRAVHFRPGEVVQLALAEERLEVVFAPELGVFGRPSSAAIRAYLAENF